MEEKAIAMTVMEAGIMGKRKKMGSSKRMQLARIEDFNNKERSPRSR